MRTLSTVLTMVGGLGHVQLRSAGLFTFKGAANVDRVSSPTFMFILGELNKTEEW